VIKKIFLLGNPNVGKSVIFSRLTGVHVISSNYPGTTVEIMRGHFALSGEEIEVVDLPGTYSLAPTSRAEEVAASLLKELPKEEIAIINIIDSTNLERNLYLTLQLIEDGYPLILCLNMCDDAKHRGVSIDEKQLEKMLGVPVIPTCAVTGVGIKFLINRISEARPISRPLLNFEERWKEIGRIITDVQRLTHRHHNLIEVFEDASVRPFTGLLIGAFVITASFKIVRFVGEFLIDKVCDPFFYNLYQPLLDKLSVALGNESFVHHLLIGDLIAGKIDFQQSLGVLTTAPYIEFGMVLPYVASFYIMLSILEDVGYLPRLAILLDSLLHRMGLHGYAIIPVLLGFGCNIPGILSTRILESRRERFIASTLISIGVPCAALQAMIFALLGKFSGFYVAGVYLVLFLIWMFLGVILNSILKGHSPELLIEIPPYRLPQFRALSQKIIWRVRGFLIEAIPVVMLGVLAVNLLLYVKAFDFVTGIFSPIVNGLFGLPKETTIALVIGFIRKDVAAAMLMPLALGPRQLFIAVTLLAVSFPCVATFAVLLKELGWKDFIKSTCLMIATGLIVGTVLNFVILRNF
jgi:ferrous iron transport protein B